MDPIKDRISATDPAHLGPSVPDGEAALRRMFSEPVAFTDTGLADVASLDEVRRRRRARLAGALTIAVAAVAAGVLVATNLGALTTAPEPAGSVAATETTAAASPSATPTPTPSATPSATPAPPVAWTTFTDSTGQATFEHPADWTVTETPAAAGLEKWTSDITVTDATGKQLARLRAIPQASGTSVPAVPYQTLDAVTLDIPQATAGAPSGPTRFTFRVLEGAAVFGSLTIDSSGMPASGTASQLLSSIRTPDGVPAMTFGTGQFLTADGSDTQLKFTSLAEAKAYMASPEYRDIKRMLISLELKSVRKPTAWTRYTSANGLGSFDYPDNWTVTSREGGRYSDVTNESGRVLLTLGFNQTRNRPNIISPCTPFTVLDSTAMTFPSNRQGERAIAPRFIFRVWDVSQLGQPSVPFAGNLGIADESWGVNGTTCDPQNVVSGLPSGEYFFAQNYNTGDASDLQFQSLEEARKYMETAEFATLKRIVMSLKITAG
ncbi:hypothetical protein [Arthrobacter sp. SO3]|uniref:hypothetical protein n=1 Tax=Arthrobacter sp. SO3 TaxID=1897057 RepID=UPI001D0017D6|nr:hypothetical protein [Arthrobacter sp. SO3]MCB5294908.1 hypothetical protein [Arthrobacter sp. SO3]